VYKGFRYLQLFGKVFFQGCFTGDRRIHGKESGFSDFCSIKGRTIEKGKEVPGVLHLRQDIFKRRKRK
jgi:hypothetical protein